MNKTKRTTIAALIAILLSGFCYATYTSANIVDRRAVERTREQIKMLDHLYKTAVVLITEHYVTDPSKLSAASAAKALFAEMKQFHEVRLVGFTGILINPQNQPQDEFERAANERLNAGDSAFERVVVEQGEQYLRYATPLPVVMQKCTMCHANFKDQKGNIGALVYKMPLID